MKNILIILLFLGVSCTMSAQKYLTKTGFTEFKASVEAFEPVEAENNSTTAILNTENGEVAALMFIKAFRFKVALMEEHFNENYMDSDKYPKATFKGKIVDFDIDRLGPEERTYIVKGTLTIKGKTKELQTQITLKAMDDKVLASSDFSVQPKDFDIKIPGIVKNKIAETVNIHLDYELIQKK